MKTPIIGISIFSILLIGLVVIMTIHYTVNPQTIYITGVTVSDKQIAVKGGFVGSAVQFRGYDIYHHNENLYIRIKGSLIARPISQGGINVSVPNTYGVINKVYLQGKSSERILIWTKEDN